MTFPRWLLVMKALPVGRFEAVVSDGNSGGVRIKTGGAAYRLGLHLGGIMSAAAFQMIEGVPTYNLFIGGEWVPSSRNEATASHNPATGEIYAKVHQAGARETEQAIAAAHGAYKDWADKVVAEREAVFLRAADVLAAEVEGDRRRSDRRIRLGRRQGRLRAQALGADAGHRFEDRRGLRRGTAQGLAQRDPRAGCRNRRDHLRRFAGAHGYFYRLDPDRAASCGRSSQVAEEIHPRNGREKPPDRSEAADECVVPDERPLRAPSGAPSSTCRC